MNDEARRILEYLQAQGAKQPPSAVVERVRGAMEELRAAAAAAAAPRFAERPAVDEWSANEVMAHVLSAGADFGGAIIRVLDGAPPGPGMREALPADVPRRTAEEWWSLLQRDREPLFARVRSADPEARIDRPIEHPFFGPLNWRETLLFMRLHDLDHAGQLNKIAAALA
jgi:hypothetical protein